MKLDTRHGSTQQFMDALESRVSQLGGTRSAVSEATDISSSAFSPLPISNEADELVSYLAESIGSRLGVQRGYIFNLGDGDTAVMAEDENSGELLAFTSGGDMINGAGAIESFVLNSFDKNVESCKSIKASTNYSTELQSWLDQLDVMSRDTRIAVTEAVAGNLGIGTGDSICLYPVSSSVIGAFTSTGEAATGALNVYFLVAGAFEEDELVGEYLDTESIKSLRSLEELGDALDNLTDDAFDAVPAAFIELKGSSYCVFEDDMGQIIAFNGHGDVYTDDDGDLIDFILN